MRRQPSGMEQRRWPPGVILQQISQFSLKRGVRASASVSLLQLLDRMHQCLGGEAPAEFPEAPAGVGPFKDGVSERSSHCSILQIFDSSAFSIVEKSKKSKS
jgi:hypothetical protein